MWCSIRESSASSRHFGLQSEFTGEPELYNEFLSKKCDSPSYRQAFINVWWTGLRLLKNLCCNLPFCFSTDFFSFFLKEWSFLHTTVCKYCFCVLCLWCLLSSWTWLSWFHHHSMFPFVFGVSDYTLWCLFKISFWLLPMLLACQSPSFQVLVSPSTIHIPICLCSYLHTFYPKEDTSCRINFKSRMKLLRRRTFLPLTLTSF